MSPIRLRVRELREAQGWSQVELSERAGGVRLATISDYESGRIKRPDLAILERLAEAFGVEPGFLLVRDEPKKTGRRKVTLRGKK